jgi:hypothetical protein
VSKHRKVRTGGRWISTPRNTPCQSEAHLNEREQLNRRIRRCRLPGEPSGAVDSEQGSAPSDLLGTLQGYCDALQRNGDSFEAWIGLSHVFAALNDHQRVRHCRDVALRLQASSDASIALPH